MRFSRTGIGALLLVLLAALAWVAIIAVSPPDPVPATAPVQEFSAERAFRDVEQISTQRHPAGSAAAAQVRQYIVTNLQKMGLEPQIQDAIGADDALGGYAMARVQNIVAVIPGSSSTGRVFLMAHYDSVQVSYGANDDGAGASTLLETARAIQSGPAPRNDIVLVFTDAEEACLCGAEAFLGQDPLAAGGGVILNFEARGSSGPAIMFETTRNNADLVGLYGSAVPFPVATSFAVEVYRILPNDTDFSPFRDSGTFTGLNSAYIDGSAAYHSPEDRADYMSLNSLQQHGSNALAMATALGSADIALLAQPSSGDSTYFPVLGSLVRYPGVFVWPIALLALLGTAIVMWLAVRRALVRGTHLAAGFALALIPILLATVAAQFFYPLLGLLRPGYENLSDPWSPGWYRLAVVALVITIVLTWYALLRKRFTPWGLALGALGWLSILGVVLAAVTPGGAYLASIPALFGVVAAAAALLIRPRWLAPTIAAVAGAVGVLILAPTVYLFFPALGLATAAAPAFFAVLLALTLLPTIEMLFPSPDSPARRIRTAIPALCTAVLVLTATLVGLVVDRFDARHPVPVEMMYAMDADTGKAFWVRPGADPTGWSDAMVSEKQDLSAQFPLLPADTTVGPAAAADLAAPKVEVVSDTTNADGTRSLQLNIVPQRESRLVFIQLPGADVRSASAAGRTIPAQDEFELLFQAVPEKGLVLDLVLGSDSPLTVRVMDGSDDLSVLPGFVPRPEGVGIEGSHISEMTLVARTVTV